MAADREADALYGLPLESFVRERDALAKRLRKEGRADEADAVKGLRKPTVVAWAVDQLAHHRPEELGRLLAAADRLREAQTRGSDDFAEAASAEREAVRAVTRAAGEILAGAGRAASDATLDGVARTLRAAAASEEARERLERGVLTDEVEPTGFGDLLGSLAASASSAPAAKPPKVDARARERKEAREALARARSHAKELREDATAAEREAAQLARAAERAERDAEKARERAEGAEAEVARAKERLDAL